MSVRSQNLGFTIVELLIVIVVIGVLAAITVAAFNGVTNRSNDAAVRSDLKNFAKRMEQYKVENGSYPAPSAFDSSLGIKFTKNAYGSDYQGGNARYCLNTSTDEFVMMSNSRSGNYFIVQPGGVITSVTATYGWGVCQYAGVVNTNPTPNGFWAGAWASWAN
jgi:prepilin-type N-terminal cleavage/methylation domain-containing protein